MTKKLAFYIPPLREAKDRAAMAVIQKALAITDNNYKEAAELLGVSCNKALYRIVSNLNRRYAKDKPSE
jgi:DNA-binding NtrC family response regulator